MAESEQFDLIVLGGGPGGYVAAIRAAQLGMKVARVEKENALGGACLRVGCIPSKALLDSSELYVQMRHNAGKHGVDVGDVKVDVARMLKRKDEVVTGLTKGLEGLFKKNKIAWVRGFGRLADTDRVEVEGSEGTRMLQGKSIILATSRTGSQWSAVSSRWTGATTRAWRTSMPLATLSAGACSPTRRRRRESPRWNSSPVTMPT
jgi:dihydrolipoamide dehydrogenase